MARLSAPGSMAMVARVLVSMQLLRVALALSVASSGLEAAIRPHTKPSSAVGVFLERQDPLAELAKFNGQILNISKKIDSLTLHCKVAQLKDKETLEGIQRELRLVSGILAANVAMQSAAQTSAEQDKAQTVKLKGQLVQMTSMCKTQKDSLNTTIEMLVADQSRAKGLRELSSKCGKAALTAIRAFTSASDPPSISTVFLQGCPDEVVAPMLAAGEALGREARLLATPFAKEAFNDILQRTSLLASDKAWPAKGKPRGKAQAKAANACKMGQGAVDCGKFKAELDTLAKSVEEQRDAAVTSQRRQVQECTNKEKQINDRITASDSQYARSSAELVRLTGIKAGLAAQRASVVTRFERTKRDAKKFAVTCKSGANEYEGDLEKLMRERQKIAEMEAGEMVAIQDCKVTDWLFSKCSKKCKAHDDDPAGYMDASRTVAQVPGPAGASCPPLSAKVPCNDKPCPIDCLVSEWAPWSACSKACGGGSTKRGRKVVTQVKDGGKPCPVIEERKSCNVGSCDDECKLKEWTPWSACSRRCKFSKNSAAGRQRRIREVLGNPMKAGGGSPCPPANDKSRFQAATCNKEICPKGITCDASQDIVFLLDASGAAGADFAHQLEVVSSIVQDSSQKVHFGVLAYGKEVKILSRVTADRAQLAAISDYSPPAGGSRNAAKGEIMGRSLFSDPGVGRGRPKIAVLLLGGAPASFADAKKAAEELRSANVRLVVGLVDDGSQVARDQACSLASKPCSANVEAVGSWEQMAQEPGRFLAGICRDLVYPGPKLLPMDEMLADEEDGPKKKKPGNFGPKQMPNYLKRQLGLD